MAAPWPTQYQQGQGQPQMYAFNAYQQPNGQHQAQQPYGQQFHSHPHSQQPYVQQPQQYPQQPIVYPDWSQQGPNAPGGSLPQQPMKTPMPQQYQYGSPERQQSGFQAFTQPFTAPAGFYNPGQPQSAAMQNQYSAALNQSIPVAPGQQPQVAPGSYQNSQHQHAQTASVASQRSNSFTQQSQSPNASTPQQYHPGPPGASAQKQSPQLPGSPVNDQQQEQKPVPCFNCGSHEHWAVSCPEPPREVPA